MATTGAANNLAVGESRYSRLMAHVLEDVLVRAGIFLQAHPQAAGALVSHHARVMED